jgi:FkbM family methyltransferase
MGVRPMSALTYPVLRRVPPRHNRIALADGAVLVSPPDEQLVPLYEEIWVRRSYLPAGWRATSDATVVDIGANVGVFAVWAARCLRAARIVAVEPSAESAAALLANLDRNGVHRASVLQVAVGGTRGDATLRRRGPGAMSTLYERDLYGSDFQPAGTVRVITLDDLFAMFAIERCDLLKIDAEGAEYDILLEARPETLARVRHIAVEYHVGVNEHQPEELESHLEGLGFEVTRFPPLDVEGGHLHASRR